MKRKQTCPTHPPTGAAIAAQPMTPASSLAPAQVAPVTPTAPSGEEIAPCLAREAFALAMGQKDSVKDFAILASLALRARSQHLAEQRTREDPQARTPNPPRKVTMADYRRVFGIPDPEEEEQQSPEAEGPAPTAPAESTEATQDT